MREAGSEPMLGDLYTAEGSEIYAWNTLFLRAFLKDEDEITVPPDARSLIAAFHKGIVEMSEMSPQATISRLLAKEKDAAVLDRILETLKKSAGEQRED